jgi:RNA recognition motif-containing protein
MGDYPEVAKSGSLTDDDDRKIFVSRVPRQFGDSELYNAFYEVFGSSVESASVTYDEELEQGKGFGFVLFQNAIDKEKALKQQTVKTKYNKIYLRRVQREGREGRGRDKGGVCFLWQEGTCTHGDNCKFNHTGPGSCRVKDSTPKVAKCFKFKKGKCKEGDACPFRHEGTVAEATKGAKLPRPNAEKNCFDWKKKGKCRKGDSCSYKHDPEMLKKLEKKRKGAEGASGAQPGKKKRGGGAAQPEDDGLHVRVFGLNYDSTVEKVKEFFSPCGEIVEVEFPVFEDSQRSKGFCGLTFSEKAGATAAVEKDGVEFEGRWLRIQRGKMFATWDKTKKVNESETKTVFVGNLDWKATEDDLKAHFQKRFGPVESVKMSKNYKTKGVKNKGFCHITFQSIFSAAKAVKADGTTIMNRRARIDFANTQDIEA